MIRPEVRINAILDSCNFDEAFQYCFHKRKRDEFKHDELKHDELVISQKQLRNNAFRYFSTIKSESECDMMIQDSFRLSDLPKEAKMAAKGCIASTPDGLKVNPDKYLQWKKLIFLNGQDLFIAASFGDQIRLDWPYSIPMDSNILDVSLSGGFAENHCHFSAAGPSFSVNWVLLHNGLPMSSPLRLIKKYEKTFFDKYYCEKDFYRFENIAVLSIYLRRWLHHKCHYGRVDSRVSLPRKCFTFEDFSKKQPAFYHEALDKAAKISVSRRRKTKPFQDYACPSHCENPIYGERKLLVDVLKAYPDWSNREKAFFYLYLICKRYISGFFVQNNSYYGFFNFKRFEQTTELLIPKNDYVLSSEINKVTFDAIGRTPKLRMAEIRTAPKNSLPELRKRISSMLPPKNSPIRYGLVLHFIKETDPLDVEANKKRSKIIRYRSYHLIENYKQQTEVIKKTVLLQDRHTSLPIVGVDAANEEIRCRPEIFAPFYRDFRYSRPIHKDGQQKTLGLHFTFHAGEDFVSLTDGLRAIDEAVEFLELGNGDRIGHASALATDVKKYHGLKGNRVLQTKQDYLDDCCFLYRSIADLPGFEAEKAKLEREINKLLIEIYGHANIVSYLRSIFLRTDHPLVHKKKNRARSFFSAKRSWFALGERYYLKTSLEGDYKSAWLDGEALDYIHLYHYSYEVRVRGRELVEIQLDADDERAIEASQRALLSRIISRNIGVETNPTSNYLIGPFEDFDDIPALTMIGLNKGKEHYRGLRISLGTDDPGLFGISLHNEYGSVLYSLKKKSTICGIDLIEEIRRIAKSSVDLSFI